MTERQKHMTWKRTQAHRDRFARSQTREWKATLRDHIKPVIDEVSESSVRDMEARIPHLMSEDPIREQLTKTVELVAVYFAKQTFYQVSKAFEGNLALKLGGLPTDQEWIDNVSWILSDIAGDRITAITDESRSQAIKIVKQTLEQGAKEGMGTSQLSVLLRDNLNKDWGKISTYRAARIARTETTMASNMGSLMGARQTGEPMLKVWLSTRDSRTRRRRGKNRYDHYGKFPSGPDGEKVEMDGKFFKTGEGLDYPGDYSGSAGNVIHCRCTMFYEPKTVDIAPTDTTAPPGPKPRPRPQRTPKPDTGEDPWRNRQTAEAELKRILGAETMDAQVISADVMKAYGETVEKLQQEGWPIQVQQFGRFGKFTGKRPKGVHAWAHQKDPRYRVKSMIEYKSSGYGSVERVKAVYVNEKARYWSPIVDDGNELQYIFTHETGHTLVQFKRGAGTGSFGANGAQVIDKAEEIYNRYKAKLRATENIVQDKLTAQWKEYQTLHPEAYAMANRSPGTKNQLLSEMRARILKEERGDWFICNYASANIEEFWAESFAMVTLSSKPSPFAQEIVALVKANIKPI